MVQHNQTLMTLFSHKVEHLDLVGIKSRAIKLSLGYCIFLYVYFYVLGHFYIGELYNLDITMSYFCCFYIVYSYLAHHGFIVAYFRTKYSSLLVVPYFLLLGAPIRSAFFVFLLSIVNGMSYKRAFLLFFIHEIPTLTSAVLSVITLVLLIAYVFYSQRNVTIIAYTNEVLKHKQIHLPLHICFEKADLLFTLNKEKLPSTVPDNILDSVVTPPPADEQTSTPNHDNVIQFDVIAKQKKGLH